MNLTSSREIKYLRKLSYESLSLRLRGGALGHRGGNKHARSEYTRAQASGISRHMMIAVDRWVRWSLRAIRTATNNLESALLTKAFSGWRPIRQESTAA